MRELRYYTNLTVMSYCVTRSPQTSCFIMSCPSFGAPARSPNSTLEDLKAPRCPRDHRPTTRRFRAIDGPLPRIGACGTTLLRFDSSSCCLLFSDANKIWLGRFYQIQTEAIT